MPQELNTKMMDKLSDDKLRPYDKITIYATGTGGHHKAGDAMEVHPNLAKKLIEDGKATDKAPKAK